MKSKPDYGLWTVARYFAEEYANAKREAGVPLQDTTIENYRQRISQMERVAGKAVTMREVTRELLEEWRETMLASGLKPATVYGRCKAIMMVVRHWRPGRFPPKEDPLSGELRELFESHYRPSRLRCSNTNTIRQYRAAIRRFSAMLDRPAELSDLTDQNVSLFIKTTDKTLGSMLLAIWRYAAQIDAVSTWPGPRFRQTPTCEPRNGALADYFEDVFLPELLSAGDISEATAKQYRMAVTAYDKFTSPTRTGNTCIRVSPHKLAQFQAWQCDIGIGDRKAADRVTFVRAVAKHACPERWLPSDPENPTEDIGDNSLQAAYQSHYVPAHPGLRDKTVGQFERACNRFGRFLGHVPTLDDLTDENLGGWMRTCLSEGLSPNTVNGYRSKIRALWQFLAEKRFVDRFPTVEKLPRPGWIPDAWTESQLCDLYAACDKMPGAVCEVPAAAWWRALHCVAWSTGERTSALFAIRFGWVDEDDHLEIPAEFRKGGRKAFLYKLTPAAVKAIDAIRSPKRELVFPLPEPHGLSWFYTQYRKLLNLAGLPYVRHKSCLQKMRRSFASHIEAAGGNATAALSHSERACTEKSYLDPRIVGLPPAAELLFSLNPKRS